MINSILFRLLLILQLTLEIFSAARVTAEKEMTLKEKNELLIQACQIGNVNLVRELINNGADLNATITYGVEDGYPFSTKTPLFYAAKNNHNEVVELLIKAGANVNEELSHRIITGPYEVIMNLVTGIINCKVDPNGEYYGETALMSACIRHDLNLIYLLIEAGANVNERNENGNTALIKAMIHGKWVGVPMVDLLIGAGADVNAANNDGVTALMNVSSKEVAELLIQAGAKVDAQNNKGQTALIYISDETKYLEDRRKYIKIIDLLLHAGANINAIDHFGNTALIVAAKHGYTELVSLLIKSRADINIRNNEDRTALFEATSKENKFYLDEKMIKLLLSEGSDFNIVDKRGISLGTLSTPEIRKILKSEQHRRNEELRIRKEALLDYCQIRKVRNIIEGYLPNYGTMDNELIEALLQRDFELAKELIDSGAKINPSNQKVAADLMLKSIRAGDEKLTDIIIKTGCDLNICDEHGNTALISAISNDRLNIIKLLLNARADVNRINRDGDSPLTLAASKGDKYLLELLVKFGARVGKNTNNKEKITTLMLSAVVACNKDMISLLIKAGANVNVVDERGNTSLILAASKGYRDIVELLLYGHADVNICNLDKSSALIHAAAKNHLAIAELLINSGANLNFVNLLGKTALMLAIENGNLDMVQLLLDGDADVNIIGKSGSAITAAIEKNDTRIIDLIIKDNNKRGILYNIEKKKNDLMQNNELTRAIRTNDIELLKALLASGTSTNVTDKTGQTALIKAANSGNKNMVELLIRHKAEIDAVDYKKSTALMNAVSRSSYGIVELLINQRANVNAINCNNDTPLMIAASHGYNNIVKLLLINGASVNKINQAGKTARKCAEENKHTEIVKLLEKGEFEQNKFLHNQREALEKYLPRDVSPDTIDLIIDYLAEYKENGCVIL